MSVQAIDWALRLVKNVTPTQKLILICLANHAGPDGDCWPSQTVVSDYSGLSRDAVNKNMKELESLGLIASERRKDSDGRETTKKYRLKMAESLGVVQDYTGGAEMRGRCSPELHPIKSTTNEEENDKSPDIAGCSPELHRGIGERHTGVVQNYTDCSPGLHKSLKREPLKEETKTKDLKTPPTPEIRDHRKAAENKTGRVISQPKNEEKTFSAITMEIPEWLPFEDWKDFVQHRIELRIPLTETGATRAISTLKSLLVEGHSPTDVIGQTILNNYRGLFPLKKADRNNYQGSQRKTFDEIRMEQNQKAVREFIAEMDLKEKGCLQNVSDLS